MSSRNERGTLTTEEWMAVVQPSGTVAASDGSTSRARPSRIDHVASVTTKGCRRSTEMMRPLTIPMPQRPARAG